MDTKLAIESIEELLIYSLDAFYDTSRATARSIALALLLRLAYRDCYAASYYLGY